MSKILVLGNGVELTFTDESTVESMVNVLNTFAEVDSYANNLSTENLALATFDGTALENVVFVGIKAEKDEFGKVILTVTNRFKTEMEILQETQAQQDEAINYLLMNSEA